MVQIFGRIGEQQNGVMRYRHAHGDRFAFEVVYNTHTEIYDCKILEQPSYGTRSPNVQSTHRIPLTNGSFRICFMAGREPKTTFEAVRLAKVWADLTVKYINDGRSWD